MNLINNPWIPVIREDGSKEKIAPWQITETVNPVIEIAAPRTDFQGALYQFLIGLLQTTLAPEDQEEWIESWEETPSAVDVKIALAKVATAFELINLDGPAFLQDFELPEGEKKPLAGLLIEAPGGKTLKDNLDHFVKGGAVEGACESCAATALFTLQTNAPSGGVGHRVGLRGGGPLTTLLLPDNPQSTLWKKLWMNVLTEEEYPLGQTNLSEILPWLEKTRLSDKSGVSTQPGDVHSLQMYWGMPRRIRLQKPGDTEEICSLCGTENTHLIHSFITKNYGVNYDGPWQHPLTPYKVDPKNKKPPLSLKGQTGGLGYRHWLGLSLQDKISGDCAAKIISTYQIRANAFSELSEDGKRLWCFGFDMDNMKARCWYEHQMPVLAIPDTFRDAFTDLVADLLAAAKDTVSLLRMQVKAAWFGRPGDAKGDTSMIDASLWQTTETLFYTLLQELAKQPESTSSLPPKIAQQWVAKLRCEAENLFDHWVLEGDMEDRNMKRITRARTALIGKLRNTKSLKSLDQIASTLKDTVLKNTVPKNTGKNQEVA